MMLLSSNNSFCFQLIIMVSANLEIVVNFQGNLKLGQPNQIKNSMIPHTLRRWMRLVGVIFVMALSLWLS